MPNVKFILILFLLLSFSSCKRSDPNLVPRDKFVQAYADLMEVSVLAQQGGLDTTAAAHAVDSVLTREDVTREQMMTSVRYYSNDLHVWNGILEDVGKELAKRKVQQ